MTNLSPPHGIFELVDSKTLGVTSGLLIGAALLIIVALGILGLYLWRRKQLNRRAPKANPWEQLRQELKPKAEQSTIERMGILHYALRRGLELKSQRPYSAWTSHEILADLQTNSEFSSNFQGECGEFLMKADRVLFANESLDKEVLDRFEGQISLWLDNIQSGRSL